MIHCLEFLLEYILHHGDVLEGDGTFLEETFGHLSVHDFVHQLADALLRIFRQAARCGFHGVGHHQYGLLLGEGVRAGIGEDGRVGFFAGVLVLPGDVEVFRHATAVVGGDEILDDFGEVVLLGQLQAVGHVADDHLRALLVGQVLVRVDAARLVFGEKHGLLHLADVMVEGAGTHQLGIGADGIGCRRRQVGHLHGVLEGARHGFGHPAEQGSVDVGQLHQCDVGREAEGLFHQEQQRVGEEQQDAVDDKVDVHRAVHLAEVILGNQFEGEIGGRIGYGDHACRLEELRALRQFAQAEDGGQPGGTLQQDELMRIAQADGADEHRDDQREEGRARVEEHPDDDGQHGVGQHVDIEEVLRHHQAGDGAVEGDACEEQRHAALVVVVLLAEEVQVEHEAQHEDADVEHLPGQHQAFLSYGFASLDGFLAEALQDVVGLGVDDFAPVDDFLSAQHDAACPGIVVQQFLPGGLAALPVILQVGGDVVVQVARPQDVRAIVQGVAIQEGLVGGLHGVQLVDVPLVGQLVVHRHEAPDAVAAQGIQRFGGEDARLVDFSQFPLDVSEVAGRQALLHKLLVVGLQAALRVRLHFALDVEERLELAQQAVLLPLHHLGILVDGEVERSHQLPVLPRLADVKLIVELAVARHEVNDDGHRSYENENFV